MSALARLSPSRQLYPFGLSGAAVNKKEVRPRLQDSWPWPPAGFRASPLHWPSLEFIGRRAFTKTMGAGSEWSVRCLLLAAWSANNNAGSEAFTAWPPHYHHHATAPGRGEPCAASSPRSTLQHHSRDFVGHVLAATPPLHQHGPYSNPGCAMRASWSCAQQLPAADDQSCRSHGCADSSRNSRRRRSSVGPLFAEDQGWLDALKAVADEPGLPLGPSKKVRLERNKVAASVLLFTADVGTKRPRVLNCRHQHQLDPANDNA